MRVFSKIKSLVFAVFATAFAVAGVSGAVYAESDEMYGFSLSPMDQKIVLEPGDSYESSLQVTNPGTHTTEIDYEASVEPFYVSDENGEYTTIFENVGGRGEMSDWITITSAKSGHLAPNETAKITFRIDVPSDAPAGGQYATILVSSSSSAAGDEAMVKEVRRIGHLVFAEIAGDTARQGEIESANVPSFLLSGKIVGSAAIKNTGNVHGTATYKLQVFPLFSDEEVYTNEENPETHTILPDRTLYNETAWDGTPGMGIYNVKYTVEFEGVETVVEKMVIVCPIWLLFIIFFVIVVLVIWIPMRMRGKKKSRK